jgi:hypothetical protein
MFGSGYIIVNSEKIHVSLRINFAHLDDRKEKNNFRRKQPAALLSTMSCQTKYALRGGQVI